VVNIAAAGSMTTTAEGVETELQRELLHAWAARRCRAICSAGRGLLRRSGCCSHRQIVLPPPEGATIASSLG
jgi:hypothetical protein